MRKAAIVVVSACVISSYAGLAQGHAPQEPTTIVRPVETQEILVNPGMGIQTFQRYNGDALNAGVKWSEEGPVSPLAAPAQKPDFPPTSVAYDRWFWEALEPEQGKVRWDIIDLALAEARRHGQRLMIRLAPYDQLYPLPKWYRESGARRGNSDSSKDGKIWQPDFNDPLYLKDWGALVTEAGRRYDGHPDLDSVDVATGGYWGEAWAGGPSPEFQVQKQWVDLYLNAFHKTQVVMNFDEPEALQYATSHGTGWRLDCWGDMRKGFGAMVDQYPEEIAETGIYDVWRTAPVSLEACGVPEGWFRNGWDVKYILNVALSWHVSTVNVKSTALPKAWKTEFEDFERRMGYRFVLKRGEWQSQVRAGEAIHLQTWWVNEGVAPIYRPFVLAFRFSSPEHSAVIRTDADLRKWLPGDAVFNDPVFVPGDLPAGDYQLSVAILDPATLQPGVKLAIEGRGEDGWYGLGKISVSPGL
jgi:hypothetical protein